MNRYLYVLSGLLLCLNLDAQVVLTDTLYIDQNNRVIPREKSQQAHSYMVRQLNSNNQLEGQIERFYKDGQLYESYVYDNGIKHGEFSSYLQNGQPLVKGQFKQGRKAGKEQKWFSNGQKQYEVEYVYDGITNRQKLIHEWDSTGKARITDGAGFITLHYPQQGYFEEGSYENGFKQGEWLGTYNDGNRYYIESYEKGVLLGGTSLDKQGNTYDYTNITNPASFKGGQGAWKRYLEQKLKYPRKQRGARAQARVPLQFVVEANGRLSNIRIPKPTHPDFDKEAMRLLKESPGWSPATLRGQKISSQLQTIIEFKLRFNERGRIIN